MPRYLIRDRDAVYGSVVRRRSRAIGKAAALYVGCVAGAEPEADYLAIIRAAGFHDIRIAKSQRINLPEGGGRFRDGRRARSDA